MCIRGVRRGNITSDLQTNNIKYILELFGLTKVKMNTEWGKEKALNLVNLGSCVLNAYFILQY